MNKQVLSPFDCDMCAMIEDITKQEIEVTASDTSIRLSWAQNGSEGNDTPEAQRIEALKQAIRGRLGDRFIEFFYADGRQSVYMKYDPEEMRTRLTDPDATEGTRYCRTLLEVDAIQFRRDNVDDVLRFTGEPTNKGCGDCANFTNEDVNGNGYCEAFKSEQSCGTCRCQEYKPKN